MNKFRRDEFHESLNILKGDSDWDSCNSSLRFPSDFMETILLSARALTKTYTMGKRSLEVLRGVDLDVARGEFLALRGASGAGKSTLLHLIGGLDMPNAGEILFAGKISSRFPNAG